MVLLKDLINSSDKIGSRNMYLTSMLYGILPLSLFNLWGVNNAFYTLNLYSKCGKERYIEEGTAFFFYQLRKALLTKNKNEQEKRSNLQIWEKKMTQHDYELEQIAQLHWKNLMKNIWSFSIIKNFEALQTSSIRQNCFFTRSCVRMLHNLDIQIHLINNI